MDKQKSSPLIFISCDVCHGFGYEVTTTSAHVPCSHCHGKPALYVLVHENVLLWNRELSEHALRRDRTKNDLALALNTFFLLWGALGIVFLGVVVFFALDRGDAIWSVFTTPHGLMALFWSSVFFDCFLYFRLARITASRRRIPYGAKAARLSTHIPLRPTHEKLSQLPHHDKQDIAQYATHETMASVERAFELARHLEHQSVTPLHLAGALVESDAIRIILARLGVPSNMFWEQVGRALGRQHIPQGKDRKDRNVSVEFLQILFYAYEEALQRQRPFVDVMELFVALATHDPAMSEILFSYEIDDQMTDNVVEWIYLHRTLRQHYRRWSRRASHKPKGIMDRAMTARPSPTLEVLSHDYTGIAAAGGFFPLVGRVQEMDQVLRILRETGNGVLLVGPAGGGKTTIFEGLAELMASEDVPKELQDKRLVVLDPGALVANAEGVGTIEGRIRDILNEAILAGNIILGIEDIHHLLNMRSTTGSEDAGGILMNAISQEMMKVIATTTTREYQEFIEPRETFVRRFQVVRVEELQRNDAILVCEARSSIFESKLKVFFSYAAIAAAVDLTTQFIQDRYLPAKALDVLKEAALLVQAAEGEHAVVTKEHIAHVLAEKTNVSVQQITAPEREKLLNLEAIMHERIVGQDDAVVALASALRRSREGLRDMRRPIGSFLFLGPTGVGKTEMAKTIAEVYFGNEQNMIRLDMSEYQSIDSMRKLIGGKGEQGYLTEAVRLKPFSIVLLDELEKAHPNVLHVFLQVLDDGRVTDGLGTVINMTNTMIIATSNAATQVIQNGFSAGMTAEQLKAQLLESVLPQWFRMEFLNRFDDIVVFKPLTLSEVEEITMRLLTAAAENLYKQKGIAMQFSREAVADLASRGYDPLYGARPLRRLIQDTVDDALAKLMLSGQLSRRDIVVLQPGGRLEIQKATAL